MKLADILVFRGIDAVYTYKIPEENAQDFIPGVHVEIPLGRSVAEGLILTLKDQVSNPKIDSSKLKYINSVQTKRPKISQEIMDFITWFSVYYLITPHKAYQTIVGKAKLRALEESKAPQLEFKSEHQLTSEQESAIKTVLDSGPGKKHLIFGVTASGKTEIYIQLSQKIISQNKNVLMLLPEIALTPQVRREFKKRFGNVVAVIHSGLTPKQREIEWNRIYQGQVKIVIGPRSALFVPLQNIGLIVVDEEHEPSYKQENNPRYFLHAIVKYRAGIHNAIQLYGSATPSIESFHQVQDSNSDSNLITLKHRIHKQPLPQVEIVDMREESATGNKSILSLSLQNQIKEKLENKEKAIILINRRGFATYIQCQKCQEIITCPNCDLSYTYHKDQKFRCHRCDVTIDVSVKCPKCKSNRVSFSGLGIQKVEIELLRLFPGIKINRLDRDAVKNTKQLEAVLDDFRQSGDLLLGTQLVAKGHHFEEVTLVGVLGIDTTLNLPDFRAPERAFQLVTQVAGRAGRAQKLGRVVVQTLQPEHHAIEHASQHDFESFYNQEIKFRQELWYPPFCTLVNIIISSQNLPELKKYCQDLAKYFSKNFESFKNQIRLLGPKPAPIEKVKSFFRYNVLIKAEHQIIGDLKKVISDIPQKKPIIRVILDFDPRSIL